jgi:hypothetical protein
LDRGEKVVYTAGAAAEQGAVLGRLRDQGIDVDAAMAEGRFELLPLAAFYPSQGQDVVVDRALGEGFPAVRMSAEAGAASTVPTAETY